VGELQGMNLNGHVVVVANGPVARIYASSQVARHDGIFTLIKVRHLTVVIDAALAAAIATSALRADARSWSRRSRKEDTHDRGPFAWRWHGRYGRYGLLSPPSTETMNGPGISSGPFSYGAATADQGAQRALELCGDYSVCVSSSSPSALRSTSLPGDSRCYLWADATQAPVGLPGEKMHR
jgi:hypothetical protein